jgi:RNA recognition motif-containing protein
MTKEIQTQIDDCTMYLEGLEQRDEGWSAEEIVEKYFKDYKVRNVHIPKNKEGKFKGIATIEFDSVATVQ